MVHLRSQIKFRSSWILGFLLALFIPLYSVVVYADLNYGSVHLLMGNPSDATESVEALTNYLMIKPQYTLSYNRDHNTPNWVSWQLNKNWLGDAKRQNNFRPDPTLPKDWYKVRPSDYENSGFDKGHIVSSEDRGRSDEDNSATFLMTNMIPQAPDNNRIVWSQFEQYCRELVKQGKELYIVAGGSGSGGTSAIGEMTLLKGKVAVPATVWKVVLVLDRVGIEPKDVTEKNSRTIALVVPNAQGVKSKPWKEYLMSVDEVEKLTGYDFFDNVPKMVQGKIESKMSEH